jgi:oligopeptide/dipeptide ABC transporter ATP-binding protein
VALTDRAAWRKVRAQGVALVFQDPRAHLDPVRSIGDFLTEAQVKVLGRRRANAEARAVRALADVGVSQPEARLRQYPHELSGGLLQRVMIASALLSEPEVLLADEPTTALDVTTQSELISIIRELQVDRGMAMLFITHDLDLAAAICDRVMVMYAGEIVESGPPSIVETAPLHPYTIGLLAARPNAFGERRRLVQLEGSPVAASEAGTGCAFRARCPLAVDACASIHPSLTASGDRAWRCLRVDAPAVAGGVS